MKIVVSGYVGKKITGIGRNLISLLNAVDDNQYIVYVNKDMKDDFIFSNANITVRTYPVSKNSSLKNLLWTSFIFPFMALKERANRALIPNFTLLLFKFVPTVVIMHDLIEFNIPDKFSKKKMFYRTKLADPITSRMADHIITVSENSKKDIMKFLNVPENKITVIYNGVDLNKFKSMSSEKALKILDSKGWPRNFILYVGTIDHPGKNSISVIKVFEKLKEQKTFDGSLILAGMPGSGYRFIENYVKESKYRTNIFLTGFVLDNELIALYSTCKLFCFLSLYEGFGIPPLEAMACGAKVVVSNTSSLPEVVGSVGRTVSPIDLKKIYEVFKETIEMPTENKDTLQHLSQFDWTFLARNFNDVFNIV
ncbi:MAG: glycosyltransferase family 4 protein [Fibrobacteraceae bacterium]|nr:glycosyltransferase family 4 protein [Fibrobacteraceae bacterium]